MVTLTSPTRAHRRVTSRRVLLVAALAGLTACSTDRILKVERPDIIDPGSLDNSGGVTALYAGVIGDLSNTMATNLGVISSTGLMADELRFGATPPEIRQMDQRAAPKSNTLVATVYRNVQQLRGQADRAAVALKGQKADDVRVGEMQAISGFAHVILAEMFCSGVPLAEPLEDGDPLTTTAVLQAGLAKLTEAATSAGADARIRNLAAVVRGRALLDLGQFDQAAAAVAGVPTDFSYTTLHATTTAYQRNGFSDYMFNFDGILVSNREGTNGLNFATAADPRVVIEGTGAPSRFDGQTPRYYLSRANSFTSRMPLVTGVEARLIEAEAALRAGNTALWLTKLTGARAPFGMTAPADPGTATARVDLMFRERAFALFASAHRLGDLRRLVRQYQRGAETVYPTGAYHKDGLQLGTDLQFVIPQTEENNPKYTACIDRAA
ncbi:MAG: hypothetical protein H7066_20815 [Cytophagaceae bacterium]|nr:hypothetical protein [Gemmatimonadaceae bacterium]